MPRSELLVTPWYRTGPAPLLTLAAMIPFVALAASLRFSGWVTTAVFSSSLFVAFQLLEVFARQGERRGAPQKQMRTIGYGVFLATATVAYLLRVLWTHEW